MFGDGSSSDSNEATERLRQDRSVLDAVRGDVTRLEARLGTEERARMEQYLTSLRDLETQLSRVVQTRGSCITPPVPDEATIGTGVSTRSTNETRPERMDATVSVFTNALTCGFTRVGVFNAASVSLNYLGPGIGGHSMWHGDGTFETHQTWYEYHATQMQTIWSALAATPEGDGTMADNTLMLWMNVSGGGHHNGSYEYWAMLFGRLGGLSGGRVIDYPITEVGSGDRRVTLAGGSDRAPRAGRDDAPELGINDLYLSILELLGVPEATYGDERMCRGPLDGLTG